MPTIDPDPMPVREDEHPRSLTLKEKVDSNDLRKRGKSTLEIAFKLNIPEAAIRAYFYERGVK